MLGCLYCVRGEWGRATCQYRTDDSEAYNNLTREGNVQWGTWTKDICTCSFGKMKSLHLMRTVFLKSAHLETVFLKPPVYVLSIVGYCTTLNPFIIMGAWFWKNPPYLNENRNVKKTPLMGMKSWKSILLMQTEFRKPMPLLWEPMHTLQEVSPSPGWVNVFGW